MDTLDSKKFLSKVKILLMITSEQRPHVKHCHILGTRRVDVDNLDQCFSIFLGSWREGRVRNQKNLQHSFLPKNDNIICGTSVGNH